MQATMQPVPLSVKTEGMPPPPKPELPDKARLRIIVDVQPEDANLSAAIQLRASKQSAALRRPVTKSEVVTDILKEALAAEMRELEVYTRDTEGKQPKKKPGKDDGK